MSSAGARGRPATNGGGNPRSTSSSSRSPSSHAPRQPSAAMANGRHAPRVADSGPSGHVGLALAPPEPGGKLATEFQEVTTAIQFVDAIATALRHRTKRLPPTPAATCSPLLHGPDGVPMLPALAAAAQELLLTHSLLELKALPSDTTAAVCNDEIHRASITVASVAAQVERALVDVQQRNVKSYVQANRSVFVELRKALELLVHNARAMVSVRSVVASRDLAAAEALLVSLKQEKESGGGGCSRTPLVQWMEQSWMPAMRKWAAIVASATHVASHSSSAREIAKSVERAHSEVMTHSASIAEILNPGESVQALLKREIDDKVATLAAELKRKQDIMTKLREAVDKVDFFTLAQAIRDTEKVPLNTGDEVNLLKTAQTLLIEVQLVANTTVGLSKAIKTNTIAVLVRAIIAANEAICTLKIYGNANKCATVLRRGTEILSAVNSILAAQPHADDRVVCANAAFDAQDVAIEHVPGRAWAAELSLLYQRAIRDLAAIREKYELQTELRQVTQQLRGGSAAGGGGLNPEAVERLQVLLTRARAAQLEGDEVAAAQAVVQSASELRLKVHFESAIRVAAIADRDRLNFAAVRDALVKVCGSSSSAAGANLRVRYQDDDGDYVSVLTSDDWAILLRDVQAARVSGGKIELFCDYPAVPSAQQQQQQQQQTPASGAPSSRAGGRFGGGMANAVVSPAGKGVRSSGEHPLQGGASPSPAAAAAAAGAEKQSLFIGGVSLAKGGGVAIQPSQTKPVGGGGSGYVFSANSNANLMPERKQTSGLRAEDLQGPPGGGLRRWDAPTDLELHTIASVATATPRGMAGQAGGSPAAAAAVVGVRPGSNRGPIPASAGGAPAALQGFGSGSDLLTTQHINLAERRRWNDSGPFDGSGSAGGGGNVDIPFDIRTITSIDTTNDGNFPPQRGASARVDSRAAYLGKLRQMQANGGAVPAGVAPPASSSAAPAPRMRGLLYEPPAGIGGGFAGSGSGADGGGPKLVITNKKKPA